MLHVAPEAQLSRLFASASGIDYLSADLFSSTAMVRMDITDIEYPDETFDVIYCSRVLEHVSDDRKAMRELHRVLRTGGWAILKVPISTAEETFEDPTITTREERERAFGQFDHVRRYGADYKDRLEDAGFFVHVDGFVRELDDKAVTRFGLMRSEDAVRGCLDGADACSSRRNHLASREWPGPEARPPSSRRARHLNSNLAHARAGCRRRLWREKKSPATAPPSRRTIPRVNPAPIPASLHWNALESVTCVEDGAADLNTA
jgi:SAM-dependent methyltransferase